MGVTGALADCDGVKVAVGDCVGVLEVLTVCVGVLDAVILGVAPWLLDWLDVLLWSWEPDCEGELH